MKHPRLPFEQLQFSGYVPGEINQPTYLPSPIQLGSPGWLEHPVMKLKGCYLLHFEPKLCKAQHYLGATKVSFGCRLEQHYEGTGAALVRAVLEAGHRVYLVGYWEGFTYHDEIGLKRPRNHALYCPVCQARGASPEDLGEVQFMEPATPYSWLLPTATVPAIGKSHLNF